MAEITRVEQQTNNPFLNLFAINYIKDGKERKYFVSSRKSIDELACKNPGKVTADAVIIIPVFENGDVVFIKQFRPAINDYIYELPAGLIDKTDKSASIAAARELHEETGLHALEIEEFLTPRYVSVGMADESLGVYLITVAGELDDKYQEENEDISFKIVNTSEIEDFVLNNNVSMQCSLIGLFLSRCHQIDELKDGIEESCKNMY